MKNFKLDEFGQVSSEINHVDQVISPNNSIGIMIPGHKIGIPFKNGEGVRIKNYETNVSGNYIPGKEWNTN